MVLRVMTFNIRNGFADDGVNSWEHRKGLTAQVIRESNCVIVGLQEVFEFQLEYLKSELPEYESYSVGREDGQSQGEQCSILWRRDSLNRARAGTFWLSDAPDVPNSMTWGNRITRICSWVEFAEGFRVYNTHWDHESELARQKSAELIVNVLPSTSWILLGDFNAEPSFPEMQTLERDLRVRFTSMENKIGTFHEYRGGTDGDCIDHLLTSPDIQASLVEVITIHEDNLYPSDHYPVVFEVAL